MSLTVRGLKGEPPLAPYVPTAWESVASLASDFLDDVSQWWFDWGVLITAFALLTAWEIIFFLFSCMFWKSALIVLTMGELKA